MSKYKGAIFNLGFIVGILTFIGLNFYSLTANYGSCVDCFGDFGFPFVWMESGWFLQNILWIGVFANILFGIIFSIIIGLIFKFIWTEISEKQNFQ